jgi:hypothetical protein
MRAKVLLFTAVQNKQKHDRAPLLVFTLKATMSIQPVSSIADEPGCRPPIAKSLEAISVPSLVFRDVTIRLETTMTLLLQLESCAALHQIQFSLQILHNCRVSIL